jgi:hypothetical protein
MSADPDPKLAIPPEIALAIHTRLDRLVYKVAGAAGIVGIVFATLGWHSLSELEEKVQLDAEGLAKMTSERVIDEHVEKLGSKTRALTEASADLRATMKSLGMTAVRTTAQLDKVVQQTEELQVRAQGAADLEQSLRQDLSKASAELLGNPLVLKTLVSAAGTIRPVMDSDGTVGCADGYRLVMLVDHEKQGAQLCVGAPQQLGDLAANSSAKSANAAP